MARAKTEVAARGLYATVAQFYYAMAVADRKIANAQQALREAQDFLDITQKLEQGGEAAHSDVIKAQIQLEQRQRDMQDAQLAADKARIGFAVLLFPDFRQDFTIDDDLETAQPLPAFTASPGDWRARNNPDIRAAQATVQQQTYAITSARAALLPSLSFDYFFGINANQFALYNREHLNNLGSVAQAQLNIPIWTWGAARSKVRQAELQLQQAKNDLSFTQRQLLSELQSFYLEAQVAVSQVDTLRRSMDLSADSLRLTLLRYQAGEVTVLEVVDAQTTLVQARNAFDDGLARYRLALASLANPHGGVLTHVQDNSWPELRWPRCRRRVPLRLRLFQERGCGGRGPRAGPGHGGDPGLDPPRRFRGRRCSSRENQASVMPKIAAPVQKFFVNRGDHVKQGQLLAVLENRDLVAAEAANKGQLDQAQANLRQHRQRRRSRIRREGADRRAVVQEQFDAAKKSARQPRSSFSKKARWRASRWTTPRWPTRRPKRSSRPRRSTCGRSRAWASRRRSRPPRRRWTPPTGSCSSAAAQLAYSEIRSPIRGVVADRPLYRRRYGQPGHAAAHRGGYFARGGARQRAPGPGRAGQGRRRRHHQADR